MDKPDALRAFITAAVPELLAQPEKLKVFVTQGRQVATGAHLSLSFELHYTLRLLLCDYASGPDAVMVPLLAWLSDNQPDLLENEARRERGIRFEAEVLNNTTVDLQIDLDLTEAVRVLPRPSAPQDGATAQRWDITHLPEPPRLMGNAIGDRVELYLRDELVAQWPPAAEA